MNKTEALNLALTDYMAAFGQALDAHGIAYGQQQVDADQQAREALAQPEQEWTPEDTAYRPGGLPQPDTTPEQLAALGWQSIECPFCGTSGAQAFPKPGTDWEGIAADQALTIALMKSEQEPLEYWNAVEGWVKIDEVRKHFDSVGCGTIYKTAGEGRAPLYTSPPKREWVGLTFAEVSEIEQDGEFWEYHTPLDFANAIEAKLKELNHD